MKDALLHIARKYEGDGDGVQRDADLLEAAMAGMGTKDERLYVFREAVTHLGPVDPGRKGCATETQPSKAVDCG